MSGERPDEALSSYAVAPATSWIGVIQSIKASAFLVSWTLVVLLYESCYRGSLLLCN